MWESEGQAEGEQVRKVEEKEEEGNSPTVQPEKGESSGVKAEKEDVIASVWELLMHFGDHQEALMLALDQKKISMSCTPAQMIGSLTETPLGSITFSDEDLPLEGRTITALCLSK